MAAARGSRKATADAGTFPMRVVTRMTGLTADTIRVWERRYAAVRPERTEGNARRYSSREIRRLTLLRDAVGNGHSIGEIAKLADEHLENLAKSAVLPQPLVDGDADGSSRLVAACLAAVDRFDIRRLDEILTRAAVLTSPRELALDVVAPLLREVGDRWEHGAISIAQEHVISAQCRTLLGTLLRAAALDPGAPRIVLAAPAGHDHDLGTLIAGVLAAARGVVPIHLGANVPWSEMLWTLRRAAAPVLVLGFSRDLDEPERRATATQLRRIVERAEVWIGAPQGHAVTRVDDRIRVFHSFEPLDAALAHRFSGVDR